MTDTLTTKDYNTTFTLTRNDKNVPLWQENRLGKYLREHGNECRVPFMTGVYTPIMRHTNLVTAVGHALATGRMSGQGSFGPATYIALGTGTTAASTNDVALQAEITTAGGQRALATPSLTSTTFANDTTVLTASWTFTSGFALSEEGILDHATSGGSLFAHQVFPVVNIQAGDTFSISHSYTA